MEMMQQKQFNEISWPGNLNIIFTRPHMVQFAGFKAKVDLFIEKQNYIVKTAGSELELEQALRLRHDVFICELLGKKKLFGVDIDRYDRQCDHLMIIEKSTGDCVGCYRLNSNLYSDKFYSEKEFHLGRIPDQRGPLLEIGRACIKKEHRNSNMMGLIWEGIYLYVMKIGARQIFGCSSIMTVNPEEIAVVHLYLSRHKNYRDDMGVTPKGRFRIKWLREKADEISGIDRALIDRRGEALLPRLIKDYFKFGAVVCGEPALDREFRCIDVLTILAMEKLNGSYLESRAAK